jgi:hypothetical protein
LISGAWTTAWPNSPHKLLDGYIHAFTGFTLIDGDDKLLMSKPDVECPEIQAFPWEKIQQGSSLVVLKLVFS